MLIRNCRWKSKQTVLFLLYLFGVFHWYLFMTWGTPDYYAYDWKDVHQWLAVVRLGFETHQIPYHVEYYQEDWGTGESIGGPWGDRYFSLPYHIASPQILALSFLSIADWMTFQLILVYTVGFWGLVKWIRKLELSIPASVFVLLLFNFNGFHSSRIGVGHLQNTGYFLVPWLLWIVNNFVESKSLDWRAQLSISLQFGFLLFIALLQGSAQMIPNMALAGLCVLLFYPRQVPWYLLGAGVGFVLGSYIVWPVLLFSPYISETSRTVMSGYGVKYQGVYSYVTGAMYRLWGGLTDLYTAGVDGSWEYDAYISLFGVVLILVCGICALARKTPPGPPNPLLSRGFIVGMSVVLFLSLGSVYKNIWSLLQYVYALPAIDRMPSRLIIYPLTYVILVSSLGFDQAFEIVRTEKVRTILKWLSLLILLILLMQHSWLWSLSNTALEWPYALDSRGGFTFGERIVNHGGDDLYITTVNISYVVSFVAAVCAGIGYIFLRRRSSLSA